MPQEARPEPGFSQVPGTPSKPPYGWQWISTGATICCFPICTLKGNWDWEWGWNLTWDIQMWYAQCGCVPLIFQSIGQFLAFCVLIIFIFFMHVFPLIGGAFYLSWTLMGLHILKCQKSIYICWVGKSLVDIIIVIYYIYAIKYIICHQSTRHSKWHHLLWSGCWVPQMFPCWKLGF